MSSFFHIKIPLNVRQVNFYQIKCLINYSIFGINASMGSYLPVYILGKIIKMCFDMIRFFGLEVYARASFYQIHQF